MAVITRKDKTRFFRNWVVLNTGMLPLIYGMSLIAVLLVHAAFGFNMKEWGTPLSQTLMQIAGGIVIGLCMGIYQKTLLAKLFPVDSSWVYTLVLGFSLTEVICGIVFWQTGLNRAQLRFIEGNVLPESLIFAGIGLVTGLLQYPLLKKHFEKSCYWILASAIGWGGCICINVLSFIPLFRDSLLITLSFFVLGSLLYGVITGITLVWILKLKISQD